MTRFPRRAFTLIEMLCVLALLAVIGMVMALLFREMLEMERSQADHFDQMIQENVLIDQFRADVAAADQALPSWEQFKADANTLILHLKNGTHLVYSWQEGEMRRHSFEKEATSERTLPLHGRTAGVEFVPTEKSSRLVRLRLHGVQAGQPTLDIDAALGGDWR